MDAYDPLDILKSFIYMNYGGVISEVKETEKIIYVCSAGSSEPWWNFAILKVPIDKGEFKAIEDFFKKRRKKPSIYFSDNKWNDKVRELLQTENYNVSAEDCWMFWNKDIPKVDNKEIIEVKSSEDMDIWTKTFIKCYPKDDLKNPYGEQTESARLVKKLWEEGKLKKARHFLSLDNNEPVAVGRLTSYDKKGYVSFIGSVPEIRGKGFGKKISFYCIKESFKQGNKFHFLATEKGHFPFDFYERLGFEPGFTAYLYTKI